MSSNALTGPSQSTRPLTALAAWLESAHTQDDKVVSFPANTSQVIRQARPPGTEYNMMEVQAIVHALESRGSTFCDRLDSWTLIILCSIFIYSQECLAQQRGLYLLAKILHRHERDPAQEVTQKQEKKKAIGQAALPQLIKGFLKTDASDKLRRWLGILALELLKDCSENAGKLRSDLSGERYSQCLGEVIEHGRCQVLKLLAGSMIRESLSWGGSLDDFWQSETSSDLYSKFPRGQHEDSQWVTSFEEFVDKFVLEKTIAQEVSSVMFAHAVYVGDREWNLKEASDILVTCSEELNIVVPANEVNPAVYIDVPFEFVQQVSISDALVPDSQQPTYGVVIQLDREATTNCILNATGCAEHNVALAFSSERDAGTLKGLLMSMNLRTSKFAPRSRAGATNISGQDPSKHELAAPHLALSDGQILIGTSSLGNAIIPCGNAVSTINPSMLERVPLSQRALIEYERGSSSSIDEHDGDPLAGSHYVEMATEGIDVSQTDFSVEQANEGIDVSQNKDTSHKQVQKPDIQSHIPGEASSNARVHYSPAVSSGKPKPTVPLDRATGIRPSSSLRSQTDLGARDNVQQSRAQAPQQAVTSAERVKMRIVGQDGEYDDLYDASPKVAKSHQKSLGNSAQGNSSRAPGGSLKSTAQQPSDKKSSPIKISRQLRNAKGVVESYTGHKAEKGLTALTENGAANAKNRGNDKKSRAPAPAKVIDGMVRSAKPLKKMVQSKGKVIATKDPPDTLDDYDLPPSPKRVDSTMKPSGSKPKATSAQLKPAKRPRNDQKKAKPVLKKAAAVASSKGSLQVRTTGLADDAKENSPVQDSVPGRPSDKMLDDNADTILEVDQAQGEDGHQTLSQSRQPVKNARKQDKRGPRSEKNRTQTQLHSDKAKVDRPPSFRNQKAVASPINAKPAPTALSQPRPRRTAAIQANKKIQSLEESDEIEDDEEEVPTIMQTKRRIPLAAANTVGNQEPRNGRRDKLKSRNKPHAAKSLPKDPIPDSVSPEITNEQGPNSVSDRLAGSSPENVNLIKDAPTEALGSDEKPDNVHTESTTNDVENSETVLHSNQLDPTFADPAADSSEARVDMVPDSVPQLNEFMTEAEQAPTSSQKDEDAKQRHDNLNATTSAGQGQSQIDVVPSTDNEFPEPNSNLGRFKEAARPQAPTAPMTVRTQERTVSPPFAGAAEKALAEPTFTRRDPFVAKLNASMRQPKDLNTKVKSSETSRETNMESKEPNTPKLTDLEKTSRASRVRALNGNSATTAQEEKQIVNTQRSLKSAIRDGGKGTRFSLASSKPAGGSLSASGSEAKRKIEQAVDTSSKRVKIAPNQPLDGVSIKRDSVFDVKKTPPPVVRKPVLIGFSASGPRNQGTVSTKKPNPPNDVGTGAHELMIFRNNEVPNGAINQVEAEVSLLKEALETPSENLQHDTRTASGAQKEVRGSSRRKEAEQLKTANAVVFGEALIQESGTEKRKFAPILDEPSPREHEQLSKRQKRHVQTPPTAQKHRPQMLQDMSPALIRDRSQRLSSQNTRVNENGSPFPFYITRNESTIAEEQYSDGDDGKDALAEVRLEEQSLLQDARSSEPTLPLQAKLMAAISNSNPKPRPRQSLSNNNKQVPSSPHASSAFGTMPPHHLYHDGGIVNAETKESVLTNKPQDPFLGDTEIPPNSFMDALRKSTEHADKCVMSGAVDKANLGDMVRRQDLNTCEDPDKTLVESKSKKRYKYVRVWVSDSSSSSQSDYSTQGSSTQASRPAGSSSEESEEEMEARWRKGLEPHQDNMLKCLFNISHRLTRHLVDKETAVNDMVTDYGNQGNTLVDRYEKAAQEQLDSHQANDDRRRQELVKMLEKVQSDRATTSNAMFQERVEDMKAHWEARQEGLRNEIDAAFAACAE